MPKGTESQASLTLDLTMEGCSWTVCKVLLISLDDFSTKSVEVSNIFKNTDSKLIKKVLQNNGKVMAIQAQKFNGLIGQEKQKGTRLGRDISSLVKFFGYGGIFHSDELPNYGITEEECKEINNILNNQKNELTYKINNSWV